MNDMSGVIVPKSDQINADDLIAGPRTITITEIDIRPGTEQPVSIFFDGDDGKPWKPCKSMSRVLVAAWGPDAKAYVGRSITLYRDPKVKWGGMEVGGIRISHLTNIEREMVMALTATKGKRAPYTVKPLTNAPQQQRQANTTDRSSPEKWAADHLGFVSGATAIERLDVVIAAGSKAMAKLETANPDLHKQIVDAYAARRTELLTDDDPFGLPPIEEGRADADHGDQHDGNAEIADKLIERVSAAAIMGDVIAIEQEYQNVGRAMLDVAQQDRVEAAIAAAKEKFRQVKQ